MRIDLSKIRYLTALDLIKCLKQRWILKCALFSELPSNIRIMMNSA